MIIRRQQISEVGGTLFVQRFRAILHETFPESREVPWEQMDAEILVQLGRAEAYGLKSERSAAVYVLTAWLLGPEFDTQFPVVGERLTDLTLSEKDKALWLEAFAKNLLAELEGPTA